MSFGFGGFGSNTNNNAQQGSGFGGFGSNNSSGTGFGQQQQNTGFGSAANNTGGSLFGNNSSGFGSGAPATGSGFGASSSSPFGASKPAFGANTSSGGGLFGSNNGSSGSSAFGGFGANNTSNNTSSPFGASNTSTSGGLFGSTANKPAFGAGAPSGSNLFGSSTAGSSGFGSTNNASSNPFGSNPSSECQGTGSTPFQPYTEKDSPGSTATNHFQSITFMAPYQKYSFEELRLADYNQGRRFGNGSGQAGAFGTTTGFGGFGQQNTGGAFGSSTNTSGGGLFGATSTSSTPFGNTQTSGAFGSNNSGGLFGAQKPAGGSLFGAANTSSQPSGGLFGTSNQSGFGTQSGTGFGTNNSSTQFNSGNQQQQKPGFSFGTNNNTATSGSAFGTGTGLGNNNGGSGGIFGNNQGTSSFGNQPQQTTTSSIFGNANQQGQTSSAFGGFGSNDQQKPSSLFGNNNASTGGIFGNNQPAAQQQTPAGGVFGNNNAQSTGGSSLFGPKPATTGTGGGLFGSNNQSTSNNSGSSLFPGFANNANQQNQGSGIFGNATQQQKPSLFGPTATTGSSLFNNPNPNNQQSNTGSIFGGLGNNQNQPQQSGSVFGNAAASNPSTSLFGNSQNPLVPPKPMVASITDPNPYGSASIFDGLPAPPSVNPGPLATPISSSAKLKKHATLPQHKINPNMASRLVTPQKRGYGFSYSTYGTPSSVSSNVSTPGGLGSSLLGSSIGRNLGKSYSTSNLNRSFNNDADSVLSPGAFSTGSSRYTGSGSMKRLTIDRSLRIDLFGTRPASTLQASEKTDNSRQPGILKKKVSFDASTVGGNGHEGVVNGTANETLNAETIHSTPSAQEQGYLRSPRVNGRPNGSRTNGLSTQPEMEQVKGNELAIVHEDESPENSRNSRSLELSKSDQLDPQPGEYYMKPSREELSNMPRENLKQVLGFIVGREKCGYVMFDRPVDLTTVDLDNIYDNIAVIFIRSLTVYPEDAKKPPRGKGLNVPSIITLENSWPRQRDRKTPSFEKTGSRFNRHVDRLRKVGGTEFVKYDKDKGEWIFRVPHFTTYALDFENNESELDSLQTSVLSEPPDTPTPASRTPKSRFTPAPHLSGQASSLMTDESSRGSSGVDDTFDFKRKQLFPGAFDDASVFDNEPEMEEIRHGFPEEDSTSPSEDGHDESRDFERGSPEVEEGSSDVHDNDIEMAGSFPQVRDENFARSKLLPRSILKHSEHASQLGFGTPGKLDVDFGDDWAKRLQSTISPRKQDRQALRESQANVLRETTPGLEDNQKDISKGPINKDFKTSIDLMNSLFGQEEARKSKSNRGVRQASKNRGFEWPYPKKPKSNENQMTDLDHAFHESYKPTWGPGSTLLYAMPGKLSSMPTDKTAKGDSIIYDTKGTIVSEGRDIRFSKFATTSNIVPETLALQKSFTDFSLEHGVPLAVTQSIPFHTISRVVNYSSDKEKSVWDLAAILFDDQEDVLSIGVPASERDNLKHRIQKDQLSYFWERQCEKIAKNAVTRAPSAEERAINHLSAHKVGEACEALLEGKDFRLATLVSLIGGEEIIWQNMATQLNEWRRLNILSEMTEPIRAVYELLAGNSCFCEGKKGPPEDRARDFVISERFDLDWKRAFGLRLWYSILDEEPIEVAVRKFATDLDEHETKKPIPWFVEDNIHLPWEDNDKNTREDLLWGLLKLFAESNDEAPTTRLSDVVMPFNAIGNPVDARFSFQLYHTLSTRLGFGNDSKADQLAWDFATQLESAGEWTWAVFVVLHLSDPANREKAVKLLLANNAAEIHAPDGGIFKAVVDDFKIPEAWVWEAKALYARSVARDHSEEVVCLQKAKNWTEAHETLCRVVAPQAVVEQEYEMLGRLLDSFEATTQIQGWGLGGQVYEDFVRLVQRARGEGKETIVKRLLGALPAMTRGRSRKPEFIEKVALQEMSRVVGRIVLEGADEASLLKLRSFMLPGANLSKSSEGAKVLQLPVPGNSQQKHTVSLGLRYYQAVMAGGR